MWRTNRKTKKSFQVPRRTEMAGQDTNIYLEPGDQMNTFREGDRYLTIISDKNGNVLYRFYHPNPVRKH